MGIVQGESVGLKIVRGVNFPWDSCPGTVMEKGCEFRAFALSTS